MIRFVVGVCCIAFLGATALAAPGDDSAGRAFGRGTHTLRFLLAARGLTPVTDWRELNADPAHSVLIILGDTQFFSRRVPEQQELSTFISQQGSIVLATDRP